MPAPSSLGRYTPEAMGDYIAGPNHVLPTSRTARFSSGLSVLDLMKRTTFLGLDARSIAAIGPDALTLAVSEGLDAHARSIAFRLDQKARPWIAGLRRSSSTKPVSLLPPAAPSTRSAKSPSMICWREQLPAWKGCRAGFLSANPGVGGKAAW